MRIAILGGGFTGLSAAYRLLQKGHQVTIFERESTVGGLAIGFKKPNWDWSLEKAYHHWFTNDGAVLNLAKEINFPVVIKRPSTDIFTHGKQIPFDSAMSVLTFPYLNIADKLRLGFSVLYLKMINNYQSFKNQKAYDWIKKNMGQKSMDLIWDPLFTGKFGKYKNSIALTWFWARIKKRTPSLAYPKGGFQEFADYLANKIKKSGGEIHLNTTVSDLESLSTEFDKILVTLPSPIFARLSPKLPKDYVKRITSIDHLHAQVLILILKKPFMDKTYWLNITDKTFPFLVLAEHTNFMDSKNYGGDHILYIGNYLPLDHPYLKMDARQLLNTFDPFLKRINPNYKRSLKDYQSFIGPFAQPIVTVDYAKLIPQFKTPLPNVYLANLDMVYPWDRGTNYAVEMGETVAKMMTQDET